MNSDEQNKKPDIRLNSEDRRINADHEEYFNEQLGDAHPVYLEPGQMMFSKRSDDVIVATVGSGVAVSIYDKDLSFGALAYILLPDELCEAFPYFEKCDQNVLRDAFRPIVDGILEMKRNGAGKNRIRIRLMGGGILPDDKTDKGTKNYVFAREYITRQGLPVLNEDLGGNYVRRVYFFPTTGQAVRRMLRRGYDFEAIQEAEQQFQNSLL